MKMKTMKMNLRNKRNQKNKTKMKMRKRRKKRMKKKRNSQKDMMMNLLMTAPRFQFLTLWLMIPSRIVSSETKWLGQREMIL